jgi:hypothetical protein
MHGADVNFRRPEACQLRAPGLYLRDHKVDGIVQEVVQTLNLDVLVHDLSTSHLGTLIGQVIDDGWRGICEH